jgi:uncharacterized DUF497 family protein
VPYQWDEEKNRLNLAKHGLAFEDAVLVFDDQKGRTAPARQVGGELRFRTIGKVRNTVLFVVHTRRTGLEGEVVIRIISARPASRLERAIYGEVL